MQGRNEVGKGGTIPWVPKHGRGLRRVPTMSQLPSSTQYLLPKDLRFEHWGAKLASCPGHYLTSLRPCLHGHMGKNAYTTVT